MSQRLGLGYKARAFLVFNTLLIASSGLWYASTGMSTCLATSVPELLEQLAMLLNMPSFFASRALLPLSADDAFNTRLLLQSGLWALLAFGQWLFYFALWRRFVTPRQNTA